MLLLKYTQNICRVNWLLKKGSSVCPESDYFGLLCVLYSPPINAKVLIYFEHLEILPIVRPLYMCSAPTHAVIKYQSWTHACIHRTQRRTHWPRFTDQKLCRTIGPLTLHSQEMYRVPSKKCKVVSPKSFTLTLKYMCITPG